jgi:iron(III) transport system permease protein
MARPFVLIPAFVAALAILALLAFVVVLSFSKMEDGVIAGFAGSANFTALFHDPNLGKMASNTAVFAGIALIVSFLLGVPLAWLAERSDLPGRSLIWTIMLASLVIPGFLVGMGWLLLAHPRIGVLNTIFMNAFHLSLPPLPVNNVVGMGLVEGIALTSLTFVLVAPSLRTMDPSLEEAARMSGASARSLLWNVTLPLILPALVAAGMYVAIVAIGAFDIPAVIGMGSRVYTFSTFMFVHAYPADGFPDYGTIAAGGSLMIVFALAMTYAYGTVLRRARSYAVVTGKAYRPRLTELGRWKTTAWVFVGLYACAALVIPFVFTLIYALLPFAQPLTFGMFAEMSLKNFAHMPWSLVLTGALHTLELVIVVPVAVVALSFAISWIVVKTTMPGRYVLDGIAFMPHAIPGILFGIGASLAALFILQKIVPIYGSVALIGIVYTIGWLSFGTRIVNSSLIQIHTDLVEAGQMSGARMSSVVREIIVPLLRPAAFGAWIYVVLLCLREMTLAAFVSTPKNQTLPMVAWTLWNNGSINSGAAVAVIVVIALLPLLFLYFQFARRSDAMFSPSVSER